jgi:hypothetical protein
MKAGVAQSRINISYQWRKCVKYEKRQWRKYNNEVSIIIITWQSDVIIATAGSRNGS